MKTKQELVLELIKKVLVDYNLTFNGDDFMGYKFKGEGSEFWNELLMNYYDNDDSEFLNSYWLKDNGVEFRGWNTK